MTRALYASLLRLHPPAFRRQFATEMLCIFDEARVNEGAFILLLDLMISLARQWLVRSGLWKVMLALGGATLQLIAGGVGWIASIRHTASHHSGAMVTPLLSDLMLSHAMVGRDRFRRGLCIGFLGHPLQPKKTRAPQALVIRCSSCATSPNSTPASRP